MTDISTNIVATPSVTSGFGSSVSDAASDGADRIVSSDFETFLTMLTAQLENQDPLNPLQSTDFAVQLATFSGVEQQVVTNDRLSELTGQLTASSMSSLSNWIGNEIMTDLDIAFNGTPVDLVASPESGATRAELIIRDANEREVDRMEISAQGGAVRWNGQLASGQVPNGNYRITTASYDPSGNVLSEIVTPSYQPVVEVLPNNGDPVLALRGGGIISAENVLAVRQPLEE